MRLSTQRDDAGYHAAASRCKVFLAGAERSNVVTADEERRYALLHRLDQNGRSVIKDGAPQFDEFHGDVRIEIPDDLRQLVDHDLLMLPLVRSKDGTLGVRAR
jgi:hypothetical protein